MKRDSHAWYVVVLMAWLTALAADPVQLERLLELDRKAIVAAICLLIGNLAMWMRASPINTISDEGREKYQDAARRRR